MIPTRTGTGISISVWFACKICRQSFQNINYFMEHKREKHLREFQKLDCIVFEERAVANYSDYNLGKGSLPPETLIKQEVISSSDDQHLDIKPAIYDVLSAKAETEHTTTVATTVPPVTSEIKQTFPKSPFVHLKRLRYKESLFKSEIKVNNYTPAYSQKNPKSLHQCRFCMKINSSNINLILHERIHTGVMPFRCIHCSRKFTWKQPWINHQGRCKSNGDLGFKMSKRGRPTLLKTIFRQAKQENPNSSSQNRIRTRTHSAVRKLANTRTEIPKRNISSVAVGTKNQNKTSQYRKKIPMKLLQTKSQLHGKRTSYTCSYCSKEFSQKGNLLNHERLHTGEAPFSCDRCGSRFKAASGLSYHLIKSINSPCSTMYKGVKKCAVKKEF